MRESTSVVRRAFRTERFPNLRQFAAEAVARAGSGDQLVVVDPEVLAEFQVTAVAQPLCEPGRGGGVDTGAVGHLLATPQGGVGGVGQQLVDEQLVCPGQ
ncbi:hypothetical protein QP028_01465 [Corynebacterium suedekumii]|nr:hypothetical protein QP028_01465 [Corynebacterium suedekumii]